MKPHGKVSPNDADTAKNRLRDLNAKLDKIEILLQPPRLIVEDATVQKVAVIMQHSGETVALLSPDAGDVISNLLGRWNGVKRTDENLWLKAFSRDSHIQDRIGRGPVALAKPCATVVLVLTPDALKDLFSVERFSNGGLLPRFLLQPSKARPMPSHGPRIPDGRIVEAWRDRINGLLAAFRWRNGPPVEVPLTPEAATAFDGYWNGEFVARFDDLEDVASYATRYAEQAKRLALVLHAVAHGADAGSQPFAVKTAEDGIEIARFFAARQLAFLARSRAERRSEGAQELSDFVSRGPVSLRDLQRRHGYDPKRVKALAKEFPGLLAVETLKPAGGGRPSEVLRAIAES